MNSRSRSYGARLVFFSLIVSLFPASLCLSQETKSVRVEITFASDWNVIEFYFGTNIPLRAFGFRSNSLAFSISGSSSLSNFSVSPHRIEVYKSQQYDTNPVRVSIICDMSKDAGDMTFATVHGKIGYLEAKVYNLAGNLLGQLRDDDNSTPRTPWNYKVFTMTAPPTSVSSEQNKGILEGFGLKQNYPNPFNPDTNIEFAVHSNERVVIKIFNALGQVVRTLADENKQPGKYFVAWDGSDDYGTQQPSGTYFYRLEVGKETESKKMVLLR